MHPGAIPTSAAGGDDGIGGQFAFFVDLPGQRRNLERSNFQPVGLRTVLREPVHAAFMNENPPARPRAPGIIPNDGTHWMLLPGAGQTFGGVEVQIVRAPPWFARTGKQPPAPSIAERRDVGKFNALDERVDTLPSIREIRGPVQRDRSCLAAFGHHEQVRAFAKDVRIGQVPGLRQHDSLVVPRQSVRARRQAYRSFARASALHLEEHEPRPVSLNHERIGHQLGIDV